MQRGARYGHWVLIIFVALIVTLALMMPQHSIAQTSSQAPNRTLTNGQNMAIASVQTQTAAARTRTAVVLRTNTAIAARTRTAAVLTRTAVVGRTNTAIAARTRTAMVRTQTALVGRTNTVIAAQTQVGRTNTAIAARTQTAVVRTSIAARTQTIMARRTNTRTRTLTQTRTVTATQIPRIGFASISAGTYHTCARTNEGAAYCWGNNGYGQLGNGTLSDSTTSELVIMPAGVTSFASISAGGYHACALTGVGAAYCWGNGAYGQLGNNILVDFNTPSAVTMPSSVTFATISVGFTHTCARTSDGEVYCWGDNRYGQLGNGDTTDSKIPVAVTMPAGVTSFASVSTGGNHTCARTSEGAVYCWGKNGYGQLGNGNTTDSTIPSEVTLPHGVTFAAINAGFTHTCARTSEGAVYCWGGNGYGQLGNGNIIDSTTPAAVTMPVGITSFASVSTGGNHTCARTGAGVVYCWGSNGYGQLGNGHTMDSMTPGAVIMPVGVTFDSLSIGGSHTCARTSAGAVYCWGSNGYGQLGKGDTNDSTIPVAIIMPSLPSLP